MHLLIVGGLGDHERAMESTLPFWRWRGYKVHYITFGWQQPKGDFNNHMRRLLDFVDALPVDEQLNCIGTSAGGIAVANLLLRRPKRIRRIIAVSSPLTRSRHSDNILLNQGLAALAQAMPLAAPLLAKIGTFYGRSDKIVQPSYSRLKGVYSSELPTHGHMLTIALALTFFSGRLDKWLKS